LSRLRQTARWLDIRVPPLDWEKTTTALLQRNGFTTATDASIRITLSRGSSLPGLLPPPHMQPTVLITCAPVDKAIHRAQRRGVRAVLLPFARDGLAAHKLLNYVPAMMGRIQAKRQRAFEALYVDPRKQLSEGTTSNLFLYRRSRLMTPPVDQRAGRSSNAPVLPGVTRRLVIEIARTAELCVVERSLRVADLADADELFCTSSVIEIVPIVQVGRQQVGHGRPGAITRQLQQRYSQMVTHKLSSH
jgi:branched-subunit amino acid aminotransferase/4-amino-4-deoxychorismate lyase